MTRVLFRYKKADRIRTYQLRMLDEQSAALWVTSEGGRQPARMRKLMTLTDLNDVAAVKESLQHELRTGGWVEV